MEDEELTPEGAATIEAVDSYLEDSIQSGRPLEALIVSRHLGEIVSVRAKQAARLATEGSWSWSDVGSALGMTKQAAHEKLRARAEDEIAKGRSKLDKAEEAGRAKIKRRAARGREGLDRAAPFSSKVDSARERIDGWERDQNDKLTRKIEKARKSIAQAERSVKKRDRGGPSSSD